MSMRGREKRLVGEEIVGRRKIGKSHVENHVIGAVFHRTLDAFVAVEIAHKWADKTTF